MNKRKIDLSDIKENDLDKTASFTDLMSRSERKRRKDKEEDLTINFNKDTNEDVLDMIDEKKKNTKDLTIDLKEAKSKVNNEKERQDDNISKTQILDLTRQMKFNFEETKKENTQNNKNGVSMLNIIGITNLLCISFYIYLLVFTNYNQDKKFYMPSGILVVMLVLLFGISTVTRKKARKFFNVLNILVILGFIAFNIYILLN